MKRVEEIDYALPQLILEVEFLALGNLHSTLDQVGRPLIDVLHVVLGSCLEEKYLVVMVTMV